MATVYKRGNTWWARVSYRGKEYRRSLETGSKRVAGERLLTFVADVKGGKWGELPRKKFDEAATKFIVDHFPRLKKTSAKRYRVCVENLATRMAGLHLDEIDSAIISDFESARRRAGVTNSTIRRDLGCLSLIFRLCIRWKWAKDNPASEYLKDARAYGLVENDPRHRFLEVWEEAALFNHLAALRAKTKHPRDIHGYQMQEAAFAFALDTGLRDEEIFTLPWSAINFRGRPQVRVEANRAKSGHMRDVPILPRSVALLKALPRSKHTNLVFWHRDGRRYSQMYIPLKRRCAEAGITEPLSFHDLRRTCGVRLLRDRGFSMEEVSLWLGHSSIKVTEKTYAFLSVDNLHDKLELSHKRGHSAGTVDLRIVSNNVGE